MAALFYYFLEKTMSAREELIQKFHSGELQYKKESEICRLLGISARSGRDAVAAVLSDLLRAGDIVRDERGRFVTPEKLSLIRGILHGNERGYAFLEREGGEDLFIPHRALHGAQHKDEVFAKIVGGERGDEAEVYAVLSRGVKELAGTFYKEERGGCVSPDDKKYFEDIRIVGGKKRAFSGEKVFVKIKNWPEGRKPEGEIEEVLGRGGELSVEEEALIKTAGLAEEFPQKALAEARRVAAEKMPLGGRRDCTNELTITIDGEDARDFDDAIGVTREGENFLLRVHIADVTHYVRRGGALDKEAYARGTSVYFPDRVLPMLPVELSNGVCSLKEGEDRLTLSCFMKVDAKGRVIDTEIAEAIIRSRNRMTYSDVTKILEGDRALCDRYAHLVPMLHDAAALAEILIQKRAARGSIDLDVKEAKIAVENGAITVGEYVRTISHRMIEEFMILANETVAAFMAAYEMPFIYRVHEKPSEEKAAAFKAYLSELGIRAIFRPENVRPGEYGKILEGLRGAQSPMCHVVNRVMLRSMSKARYSDQNSGHFGLASDCYCHFTSPIRRYPDLLIHHIIKLVLEGQAGEAQRFESFVGGAALRCSETERRADEAERAVDELYKVWYMREHLGEMFEGVVSGVTAFAVFVELPNTVEGRIRIENLPPDDYIFIEQKYMLKGERRAFKIGDAIKITVAACDIGTRKCDFLLAEE